MSAKLFHIERCWTGRMWLCLFGSLLALGFRGARLERAVFKGRMVFPRQKTKKQAG